ncbi:carboxypeptidase-like regulatory domain-containing protein [bacterium]|nr:carboxypeptidase-like regulatory domain-containing protein [bacterium]
MTNKSSSFLLFSFLLTFVAISALGQAGSRALISGRVVEAETGQPLPGAHVFIASSMIGTVTNTDGQFNLHDVPVGAHRLYVSMLGFEPDFRDIMLRTGKDYQFDFELKESILDVGEIIVEAERDKNWKKRLEKFTRMFIGETPNALETSITNPEVLDFDEKRGSFTAVAAAPLIIENRALGYRIQYFLKDFESTPSRVRYDGEGLYEEMDASSEEEATRWEEKRRAAFIGSFRHFMLAIIAGRSEAQGFKTYSRPSVGGGVGDTFNRSAAMAEQRFPLDPTSILKPGEAENEYFLDFEGHMEIVFMGEKEDESYLDWSMRPERSNPRFQTSWTFLDHGPAVVDYKGDTLDPYGVVFMGYWAFERVADDPPKEYRPR